ncbi:MAG TPA: MOSC N-terminal beta barrel domain-containing protein, partial [Ktedonobacteraceae bacterium]
MACLSRICIYPVKALDSLSLTSATLLASGALMHDRAFALFDEQGKFVNGKRNPKVHRLRSHFSGEERTLALRVQDTEQEYIFSLDEERAKLNAWLSTYFDRAVTLVENTVTGFPDDTKAPGPTVISTATLREVASWFPGFAEQDMRLRFRANLEIDGVPAFWEDRLFAGADEVVAFRIGDVLFEGTNPCQRCVVPSRDARTGEVLPHFQEIFMQKRKEYLPSWSTQSRFNHFYRLSCNTRVPASEAGKSLQI